MTALDLAIERAAGQLERANLVKLAVEEITSRVSVTVEAIKDDDEMMYFLSSSLRQIADLVRLPPLKKPSGPKDTAFSRVLQYFANCHNEPTELKELCRVTGTSIITLRQLIYKRRRDRFVRIVGKGMRMKYKLSEPEATP